MNILEELWYGNIAPNEIEISKGSELDKQLKEVISNEDKLYNTLTDEQKQLFENLKTSQLKYTVLTKCKVFVKGFKLGTRMILESLDSR
jgi:hypothetical protein